MIAFFGVRVLGSEHHGARHAHIGCLSLAALLLSSCSINKTAIVEGRVGTADAAELASQAEARFATTPRTWETVEAAYQSMEAAVRGSNAETPNRYQYLYRAARFAIWLAAHAADGKEKSDYAEQAIVLGNTALQTDSSRVEGYYYRAIAIGLFAQENKLRGRSAQHDVRDDATRAIDLDPTFDYGGPHRVLGALYLRAPGPPAGLGSIRRALVHLEAAYEIAPVYPDNILFLAEAYITLKRTEEASVLLDDLLETPFVYGDPDEQEQWRVRAQALRRQVEKKE